MAAWAALIARLTGQRRLVVPIASADRREPRWASVSELTTNVVPVLFTFDDDPTLGAIIADADRLVTEALRDQVPLALLAAALRAEGRDPEPLLTWGQVVMESWSVPVLPLGAGTFEVHSDRPDASLHGTAQGLAWTFQITEDGALDGGLIARFSLLADPARRDLARWFVHVLREMGQRPETRLSALSWCDPAERQRAILLGTGPDAPRTGLTALDGFLAQARRTPDAIALQAPEGAWTWRELAALAARIAGRLQIAGVARGDLVALALERSAALAAAILGTWWTGAAFTVLDPREPVARRRQILEDAAPKVVLSQREEELGGERVLKLDLEDLPEPVPVDPPSPDDLAYVLFTSGSTGRPKGARNLHRGLANILRFLVTRVNAEGASARTLWHTAPTFDPFLFELFVPLLTAGTVVVAPPGIDLDPERLVHFLAEERITVMGVTPSLLGPLLPALARRTDLALRRVDCIGEPLTEALVARFHEACAATLVNWYGPVEAAIAVTREIALPGQDITVGRPCDGVRIAIVDAQGVPLPAGVRGEVRIAGVQVGDGYHRRPELTAERFGLDAEVPGERTYRTGDLGRLLPDGRLVLLGRTDDQVKIRGVRVEPGEVQHVLCSHPAVRDAVVLPWTLVGGPALAAWVVAAPGTERELLTWLRGQLPAAMVAASITCVDTLPTNASGKVDRARLPVARPLEGERAPGDGIEATVAEVFAQKLGLSQVGREDDFFLLGGHSLLAIDVVDELSARGLDATLPLLFGAPTPRCPGRSDRWDDRGAPLAALALRGSASGGAAL